MAKLKTYFDFEFGPFRRKDFDKWIKSENPATGKAWARIPEFDVSQVNTAVWHARQCLEETERLTINGINYGPKPWSMCTGSDRALLLRAIGLVIQQYAKYLGEIETRDTGKPIKYTVAALRTSIADTFNYYAALAETMEGSAIPVDSPNILNYTKWEPYGVCALISAWNSPLGTLMCKLAPALAAGNAVVIKPSEHATASTLEFLELLRYEKVIIPYGLINVVTGYGGTVGDILVNHPGINMVSFTGGVETGKAVAAAAARQVKPVVLELGGKSPQIVLKDANLKLAVNGVVAGIFPVAGQSCIAGARVLVHRSLFDKFCDQIVEVTERARVGDPTDEATHMGPIANRPHYKRVLRDIAKAEAAGARLLLDGRGKGPKEGFYIGPTIFADVTSDISLVQDEIFGPVMSIQTFDDEDEAVRMANDTIYGLAAGIWSRDTGRAMRIANQMHTGTVYINNYFDASPRSPVGGYKQSGYGRENGIEGIRSYMQCKSVWVSTKPNEPDPFPEKVEKLGPW